jgi:hypothetical protein
MASVGVRATDDGAANARGIDTAAFTILPRRIDLMQTGGTDRFDPAIDIINAPAPDATPDTSVPVPTAGQPQQRLIRQINHHAAPLALIRIDVVDCTRVPAAAIKRPSK